MYSFTQRPLSSRLSSQPPAVGPTRNWRRSRAVNAATLPYAPARPRRASITLDLIASVIGQMRHGPDRGVPSIRSSPTTPPRPPRREPRLQSVWLERSGGGTGGAGAGAGRSRKPPPPPPPPGGGEGR